MNDANEKLNIRLILLIGMGLFGVTATWSLFMAYVPIFLKSNFDLSSSLIGLMMTLNNLLGVLLLPYLGALSDRTHTRIGRRRPYLLVGAPIAALFFVMIPIANEMHHLSFMISAIVMMNLAMVFFKTPVAAIMPDVTPSKFRSLANGLVNLVGGFGALLVYFVGKKLYDTNPGLPFYVVAVILVISCLLVVIFVKEKLDGSSFSKNGKVEKLSFLSSFSELKVNMNEMFTGEKSLLFMLLATLFWFVSFTALGTFFTSYVKYHLGFNESDGALMLGYFALAFMLNAVFAGMIGSKYKRNTTIKVGLLGLILVTASCFFVTSQLALSVLIFIAGWFWALVNVNSLPMVVDMTTPEQVGGYTGLYYFFSQVGTLMAPLLAGALMDWLGYRTLMPLTSFFAVLALICMFFVKRGEAVK